MENSVELLTIPEAAKLLRIEIGTLRNLVYKKKVPYTKPFGSILFDKNDLLKCIEQKKVYPIAEKPN